MKQNVSVTLCSSLEVNRLSKIKSENTWGFIFLDIQRSK